MTLIAFKEADPSIGESSISIEKTFSSDVTWREIIDTFMTMLVAGGYTYLTRQNVLEHLQETQQEGFFLADKRLAGVPELGDE